MSNPVKILHIYPELMSLYGEYGNITILTDTLIKNGFEVTIDAVNPGDDVSPQNYDFVFVGGGSEKSRNFAAEKLLPYRQNFVSALESGTIVLATATSYTVFGEKILIKNKLGDISEVSGLAIFPFTYEEGFRIGYDKRETADVIFSPAFMDGDVIGFLNRKGELKGDDYPMFVNKKNLAIPFQSEGFHSGSFYGTSLVGPLLVKNPLLCRYFVGELAKKINGAPLDSVILNETQVKAFEVNLKGLSKTLGI